MKVRIDIRLSFTLLLALLLAGCSKDDTPVVEESVHSDFVMYIYMPDQSVATRTEDLLVNATAAENAIHSLKIWVFDANGAEITTAYGGNENGCIYRELTNVSLGDGVTEVIFSVPNDFKEQHPTLDVYVIANAASLTGGSTLDASTPKTTLREFKITDADFGVQETTVEANTYYYPTTTTSSVVTNGLPMSACVEGATVVLNKTVFSITQLTLKRAVSKVRFVFSRANPEDSGMDDARVTAINLDGYWRFQGQNAEYHAGSIFPTYEYLFSGLNHVAEGGVADMSATHDISVIDFAVPTIPEAPYHQIPEHENPWVLRWDYEETRQEWEDILNEAINNGKAIAVGFFYLRESDRHLSGTIKYEVETTIINQGNPIKHVETQTARFSMNAENGFLRNHTWTIYGYFSEGGAVFEVANWDEDLNITYPGFK